jgi:hypothetical protein
MKDDPGRQVPAHVPIHPSPTQTVPVNA